MNNSSFPDLTRYPLALTRLNTVRLSGRIIQVVGLTIEATGLDCQIGGFGEIRANDAPPLYAEVVGFREQRTLLMPLGDMQGIQPGAQLFR
jgi:flagellum-specific ATP synthase/type III secretion protein N (ATPase)